MSAGPEHQIKSADIKLVCESMVWSIGGLPEIYFTFNPAAVVRPADYRIGDVKFSFSKYVVTSATHHPPYIAYRIEGCNERYRIHFEPINIFVYNPQNGPQPTRAAAAAAIQRLAERKNRADDPNEYQDAMNFR